MKWTSDNTNITVMNRHRIQIKQQTDKLVTNLTQ